MTGQAMFFAIRKKLVAALIGCSALAFSPHMAVAQILEELQVQPDNFENVIRLQFNARIQFLKAVQVGKTNTVLVYFRILQGEDLRLVETLKSKPFEQLPAVTATLSPQASQVKELRLLIGKGKAAANFRVVPGSDGRSIDIVFGKTAKQYPLAPDNKRYALTLLSSPSRDDVSGKIIPREFQDYAVFTSQQVRDGKTLYELNMGYFASREQAEQVRFSLLSRFPETEVTDLLKRREIALAAASATAKAESAQVAAPAPLPDVENEAATLMPKAQEAMKSGDYESAIDTFNQILLLPPNKYSQDAQELIGEARARNGELAKARAEYELYLKLFPDGAGAERVRRQLAELATEAAETGAIRAKTARRDESVIKTVTGSLSQYYFGGSTQTQTAFDTPTTVGTSTLSAVDQSSLRTHLDLTGRYRNADADQKLVFRDDNIVSFIDTRPSLNHVLAAFYSYKGLNNGFNATLGRQIGTSGGVLGRFDGAQMGYYFAPKWRANVVAGVPVEFPALGSDRRFWGASLDAEQLTERLQAKTYFINQTVDGIEDRRAVGLELAFFDMHGSANALVDYDIDYNSLNIGTLQGNWTTEKGGTFSFLLDYRHSPLLTTSAALYNAAVTGMSPIPTSIKQLLGTTPEDQIRIFANNSSAVSKQIQVGYITPLNTTWQVGADFNLVNTGALPGATLSDGTVLPPSPATGNIYTYSMRAIGSGLLMANDVNVFTLSLNKGNTFAGQLVAYNNVTRLNRWTLEPSLKYYHQKSDPDTKLSRWTPEIHVTYLWKGNLSLEADYIYENSTTTSPGINEVSQQHFFYVGYRWDI